MPEKILGHTSRIDPEKQSGVRYHEYQRMRYVKSSDGVLLLISDTATPELKMYSLVYFTRRFSITCRAEFLLEIHLEKKLIQNSEKK